MMPSKRIPTEACKFWLAGKCRRSPCLFLHGHGHGQPLPYGPSPMTLQCMFWLAGKCSRHPCPYLHSELPQRLSKAPAPLHPSSKPPCQIHCTSNTERKRKPSNNLKTSLPPKQCKIGDDEVSGGGRKPNINLRISSPQKQCKIGDDEVVSGGEKKPNNNLRTSPSPKQCKLGVDEVREGGARIADSILPDESQDVQGKAWAALNGAAAAMVLTATSKPPDKPDVALITTSKPFDEPHDAQDPTNSVKTVVCQHFLAGKCSRGVNCTDLHQWFSGNNAFSYLSTLRGHETPITGIALPSGSNKLWSGSQDGVLRVWDCDTAECIWLGIVGVEINCLISEGPWVFIGIQEGVKACNTKLGWELNLHGPMGRVNALEVGNDILFVGLEDGRILAWKFDAEGVGIEIELVATLIGHKEAVVSFTVGQLGLYSGSADNTIKVWDLKSLECMHTLVGHTSAVTSMICWTDFLLSCSLDCTIKVWAFNNDGEIVIRYTHNEDHGVLAVGGIYDADHKPHLVCSYVDGSICVYELPLFGEKGKVFSTKELEFRIIQVVPEVDLLFTGEKSGEVKVWKLSHQKVK